MSADVPENSLPEDLERVPSGWESERNTERAKVNVRWLAVAILFGILHYIRRTDPGVAVRLSVSVTYSIAIAALGMTALEALYLWSPGRKEIHPGFKYLTVLGDMVFVSTLIHYTGFTQSPFFFVYFVMLISNCLRYGLLMSLYVALTFNILYSIVLAVAPPGVVKPSVLGGEGLKILAFWAVAFYGGAVSARLMRQANQMRVYEETILELRTELASLKTTPLQRQDVP